MIIAMAIAVVAIAIKIINTKACIFMSFPTSRSMGPRNKTFHFDRVIGLSRGTVLQWGNVAGNCCARCLKTYSRHEHCGGGYYLIIAGVVRVVAVSISFAIREKKLSKSTFPRLLSRSQDETRQLHGAQARLSNLSDIW